MGRLPTEPRGRKSFDKVSPSDETFDGADVVEEIFAEMKPVNAFSLPITTTDAVGEIAGNVFLQLREVVRASVQPAKPTPEAMADMKLLVQAFLVSAFQIINREKEKQEKAQAQIEQEKKE